MLGDDNGSDTCGGPAVYMTEDGHWFAPRSHPESSVFCRARLDWYRSPFFSVLISDPPWCLASEPGTGGAA